MQQQLINALKQAANGQYPTTIRHLQPLLEQLGWTPKLLTEAVKELEAEDRLTGVYANNKVKQISLPEDFD